MQSRALLLLLGLLLQVSQVEDDIQGHDARVTLTFEHQLHRRN